MISPYLYSDCIVDEQNLTIIQWFENCQLYAQNFGSSPLFENVFFFKYILSVVIIKNDLTR